LLNADGLFSKNRAGLVIQNRIASPPAYLGIALAAKRLVESLD
jgi:hypothetical protein